MCYIDYRRTWNITSLPKVGYRLEKFDAVFYQEIILLSGVFRGETASGFYPWGKVDSPRERVAEGLCAWRHGNSFPMTQSAQFLHQMRSIPHCSKAVFYVFVSIHDSATKHNLSPGMFHWVRISLTTHCVNLLNLIWNIPVWRGRKKKWLPWDVATF